MSDGQIHSVPPWRKSARFGFARTRPSLPLLAIYIVTACEPNDLTLLSPHREPRRLLGFSLPVKCRDVARKKALPALP